MDLSCTKAEREAPASLRCRNAWRTLLKEQGRTLPKNSKSDLFFLSGMCGKCASLCGHVCVCACVQCVVCMCGE